jgi:hypothetical protein
MEDDLYEIIESWAEKNDLDLTDSLMLDLAKEIIENLELDFSDNVDDD